MESITIGDLDRVDEYCEGDWPTAEFIAQSATDLPRLSAALREMMEERPQMLGALERAQQERNTLTVRVEQLEAENKQLKEQWNTRFNTLCGNCGKRYRGPRDENQHGLGVCALAAKE